MKKTFLVLSVLAGFLIACGGNSEEQDSSTTATTTPPPAPKPAMEPGELLIVKSDCIGCHNKETKIIGPSYLDVAAKYPASEENITYLADKIVKGGKGVWGTVPMTPHPKVSMSDAKTMATYILSLKK